MPLKFKSFNSEGGAIPFIILLASLGLLAFLVISNIFNFKDTLFNSLYPKPSSRASLILTPDNYGFNAGGVEESDPQYLNAISLARDANIGWIRASGNGCDWGAVQSADGKPYNWTKCDSTINNIVNVYGRSFLHNVFYSVNWCSASPPVGTLNVMGQVIGQADLVKAEPCDYQKYYDYTFAFISRYGSVEHPEKAYTKTNGYAKGWIKYFEMGNEPDGSGAMLYYTYGQTAPAYTGTPPADLQQKMSEHYGHIVQQTYQAVKAADPSIQVVLGGLIQGSKPAPDFLNNILGNAPYTTPYSIKGYFDIMNYHCYCNLSGADSKFDQV
ncbi:hypothetical protein HY025_06395, partial [Candidatus Daviesbacteria bacterium]|nr:hypothetical protein [Candidatus Daviesbacteria bacterium]